jgi:hypothetical protein
MPLGIGKTLRPRRIHAQRSADEDNDPLTESPFSYSEKGSVNGTRPNNKTRMQPPGFRGNPWFAAHVGHPNRCYLTTEVGNPGRVVWNA